MFLILFKIVKYCFTIFYVIFLLLNRRNRRLSKAKNFINFGDNEKSSKDGRYTHCKEIDKCS